MLQTVTKFLEQYVEEVLRQAAAQLADHPERPKLPLVRPWLLCFTLGTCRLQASRPDKLWKLWAAQHFLDTHDVPELQPDAPEKLRLGSSIIMIAGEALAGVLHLPHTHMLQTPKICMSCGLQRTWQALIWLQIQSERPKLPLVRP